VATVTVTLINRLGLHARAANKFVSLARTFESEVTLAREGDPVDGKSIMSVLLLAAPVGTELTMTVSGKDEEEALAALQALIANRFGEED